MPSGLVLYWLTNSLLMMTFQYFFMKTHATPAGTPQKPIIEKK
jgi:membrane protein insertase Oxa1/YidC/SpoIIIJ